MVIVSVVSGLGYISFIFMAFSFDPKKKYYHRLFKPGTYLFHLTLCFLVAVFGYYRITVFDSREVCFLMPLAFIIIFRVFDFIVVKVEGRHILVVTRGDKKPNEYKWWIDGTFTLLSAIIPFLLSLVLASKFS